jgi:pyruvate dehydrogenase E1 component alpha subunit
MATNARADKAKTSRAKADKAPAANEALSLNDPSRKADEECVIYKAPAKPIKLPDDTIRKMYREMLLLRRFEERTAQQYQLRKIQGFCHLYIGQEAVGVGSINALQSKDYIITTYRDHGHALLRGISSRSVMAELFGKAAGCSKGKGGSMHLFNAAEHMLGGHGIVGGHVPLATGVGWKAAYNKTGEVVVCYMGEAALNQGVFHESLNMASLWNLPVIYIVENNLYGMGTAVHRASAEKELYKRTAGAYRIRGVQVDGMDVLAMYDVVSQAAERARETGRPTFIEAICYRYRGHSMSDPATTYRTKDEVNIWRSKDPMTRLAEQFPKILTETYIEQLEKEIREEVQDAIDFADAAPQPDPKELWTDVYIDYPGYPKASES